MLNVWVTQFNDLTHFANCKHFNSFCAQKISSTKMSFWRLIGIFFKKQKAKKQKNYTNYLTSFVRTKSRSCTLYLDWGLSTAASLEW